MGFPIVSAEGSKTAWGNSAGDFYQTILDKLNEVSVSGDFEGTDHEIQENPQDFVGILAGMYSGSGTLEGIYRNGAPVLSNVGGLVTLSSLTIPHITGYDLLIESVGVHKITPMTATTGEHFRPDVTRISGTIRTAGIDSATALVPPTAAGTIASGMDTITFRYDDAATDATIAGKCRMKGPKVTKGQTGLQTVEYGFTGAGQFTTAGTNQLFATPWDSAIGLVPWSQDNTTTPEANYTMVVTMYSGKTATFEAFAKSIRISVNQNEPVRVSVAWQANKSCTIA